MAICLTEDEIERLFIALGKGQDRFTKKDAFKVLSWANKVKIESNLLDLVLAGEVVMRVRDGKELIYCQRNNAKCNAT